MSWDVIPNSISVAIQYLSLDWPAETGWVNYNSLQLIAYFVTVFLAAPAALISGLGMSPALSTKFKWISSVFSIQVARSLHFIVMVWFLLFIVVHVTLVLTTGALRNLNHMYASRDDETWVGFWIFAASMVVIIVGWVLATPLTIRYPRVVQRVGYALIGPAQRLFEHIDSKPGQYTEKDISPYLWHNGQYPDSEEYKALFDGNFADYRLRINGLVAPHGRAGPARAAPSRADHPALLHPGLVRGGQVGRRVHEHDPGAGPAEAGSQVGCVLLVGGRSQRWHLLRRAPDRADALSVDDAGVRHERRATLVRPWSATATPQRGSARLQAGQMDRRYRVRR
jgi:hypothetical protein